MHLSSGNIKFNTFNFEDLTLDELASIRRTNIGFVYQFHHLIPEFSAIDNASFPLLLNGDTKEEAYVKAEDILNKLYSFLKISILILLFAEIIPKSIIRQFSNATLVIISPILYTIGIILAPIYKTSKFFLNIKSVV